ncbi:MAG TPA: helix-turn-helix transcriptional regulator [Haliangiales bacterium]|nr:helix-turn-helix transcriptional regulator [Haliangiales bacterium]
MQSNLSLVGSILREWRGVRRMSQLHLAMEAEVSPRHLSFVETGRAVPSREMVLMLARALDVPFRDRNAMLTAAGYAPVYRETSLDAPQMAEMRRALELLLRQNEPFGAVALDRSWDIVMCNAGYARFVEILGHGKVEPYRVLPSPRANLMRLLFGALRPAIANWDDVARSLLERARREASADRDPARRRVLEECLRAAPAEWRTPWPEAPSSLVLTVDIRVGDVAVRLFTTIATLGTAQDITLQELHIESFHPADAATEQLLRALAG